MTAEPGFVVVEETVEVPELPAELAGLIADLTFHARFRLALGPVDLVMRRTGEPEADDVDDLYGCRVCGTLLPIAQEWLDGLCGPTPRAHAAGAAATRLFDWHQGLDKGGSYPRLTEGPVAFGRCLAIYRAAGWRP
jgi:hypothetical protein